MSGYSKIPRDLFGSDEFRGLSNVWTRMLWLSLVSNPKNTCLPGLMVVSIDDIAATLGWEAELGDRARAQLEASLQELEEKDWVRYHRSTNVLLAARMFDLNVPRNPSVVAHWKKVMLEIPRCILVDMWARMARRKFRELDRSASDRLGGKAWRLEALEEFLADIDDCYSPPSYYDDDMLTEEDLKHMHVIVSATPKGREYAPLSRKRKAKAADTLVPTDTPEDPEEGLPDKDAVIAQLSAALDSERKALTLVADQPIPTKRPRSTKKNLTIAELHAKYGDDVHDLCRYFLQLMKADKPDMKLPTLEAMQGWYDHMNRLVNGDERGHEPVAQLIEWIAQDDFEKANVRCPRKLRERYDQLELKMDADLDKKERARARGGNGPRYLEPYVGTYEAAQARN